MNINIRRQHHVWRYYLESWANNKQIYCKHGEKIFITNLINIAVESNFYRIKKLTDADIKHLEYFKTKIKFEFLELDNYIINTFFSIINSNEDVELLLNNFEEKFYSEIERNSIKYIDLLKNCDGEFFKNYSERLEFIIYISTQYFRTKKFKEIYTELFNSPIHGDSRNLVNIIRQIFTFNYAVNLVYKNYNMQLLLNESEFPFITGDQPVINLNGDGKNPHDETVLYYPITPKIAIKIFCFKKNDQAKIIVNNDEIKYLNNKIYENSYLQIYSNNEESLKIYNEL